MQSRTRQGRPAFGRYGGDGIYLGFAAVKSEDPPPEPIMRYTTFTTVALSLITATALGQQRSGRNSAMPKMVMNGWVRRSGRWEAVAQSLVTMTTGDNVK